MGDDKTYGPEDRKYGPEPEPVSRPENNNVVLGFLPDHVDVGPVQVGFEKTFEIAQPMLFNGDGALITSLSKPTRNQSTPSAFRDQLGLDPDPVLQDNEAAAFELASPTSMPIQTFGAQPQPIRLRVKPTRSGALSTVIEVKVVGSDGSFEHRQIRVSANGYALRKLERHEPPPITNDQSAPNYLRDLPPEKATGAIAGVTFDGAADQAKVQLDYLSNKQANGATTAEREILAYSKAPLPKQDWSWFLELAINMGVAGIAGLVAKSFAKGFATRIAQRNAPSTGAVSGTPGGTASPKPDDGLQVLVADGLKEGFKGAAKKVIHASSAAKPDSSNDQVTFFAKQDDLQTEFVRAYGEMLAVLKENLREFANDEQGTAAMNVLATAFNAAAASARDLQIRAVESQWISAVAKRELGSNDGTLPDGTKVPVSNLSNALDFGTRGPYATHVGAVPPVDGVLDIHVDVPTETLATPEVLQVRAASYTGISQEVADRVHKLHLREAGIPLRIVVRGQPALITRDEIGNVRVMGHLKTVFGNRWSERHMHQAAKLLVNAVLGKTLEEWGVKQIKTDDASGVNPQGAKS